MKTISLPRQEPSLKLPKTITDKRFWKSYFRYYDILLLVKPYQRLLQNLSEALQVKENEVILDAGCGTGNINYFIQEKHEMHALDSSQAALERLAKKFPRVKPYCQSLLHTLPFPNDTFDKVLCCNVLYTLPFEKWPELIQEWKRVLKPGGRLVLNNPTQQFSPIKIYGQHIALRYRADGLLTTLKEVCGMLIPTFQMLRYNQRITQRNKTMIYHFVKEDEQIACLAALGFVSIEQSKSTYANQAIMDVFIKP